MSKCTTYVIPVELIVCKADIMRDPVTEDTCGCPAHEPCSERGIMDYSHAKQEVEIGGGSAVHYTFTTIGACNGVFMREVLDRRRTQFEPRLRAFNVHQ